jgi:predicted DsbA family dithiol-disulfide isomerase
MRMNRKSAILSFILLGSGIFWACSPEVKSKVNFLFRRAANQGDAIKVESKVIKEAELFKGIEQDIYEAEMKVFELKMNKVRSFIFKSLMESDPKSKGLSNDEYLDKFISKGKVPTEAEIKKFIADRKIPENHVTDELKERVTKFLTMEIRKGEVEAWLADKTKEKPVEVFFSEPIRPTFDVPVGASPTWGSNDAKVKIVEYSEFECPFCAKGAKVVKQLKEHYGEKKIQIIFKHYPLDFHQHAMSASHAAVCALEQSKEKFWELYYALFEGQDNLTPEGIKEKAQKIKLDMVKFAACQASKAPLAIIEKDMQMGRELGVKATPTFYINGMQFSGALPLEEFVETIDKELQKEK